jgi:hypothetical protein
MKEEARCEQKTRPTKFLTERTLRRSTRARRIRAKECTGAFDEKPYKNSKLWPTTNFAESSTSKAAKDKTVRVLWEHLQAEQEQLTAGNQGRSWNGLAPVSCSASRAGARTESFYFGRWPEKTAQRLSVRIWLSL